MITRFGICLVLVSLLGACSSVPDRYAPWRDNDAAPTTGKTPNLGDVPAAPNVNDAKAEMDSMRQRLESDRANAYQAAGAPVPVDNNNNNYAAPVTDSDLAPPPGPGASAAPSMMNDISSTNLPEPMPQSAQQQPSPVNGGDVYYNYDSTTGSDYTYGYNSPVSRGSTDTNSPDSFSDNSSGDQSVAIDMSVLGGSSNSSPRHSSLPQGGISAGEPIAYFAYGSAKLGPKDRSNIRQLASQLKQSPQTVVVAGNASQHTGVSNIALSREINLKMSERRANAVMDELIKLGVSPEQIFLSAYGDSMSSGSETNDRRVDVTFNR
jgi:outer membrane protein OmpA-like peptidoglycan-associated protein